MRRLLRVALRSLRGHASRYAFVMAVLTLGFAFITAATAITDGMLESVTNAAFRHYAGHILIVGRDKDARSMMVVDHAEAVDTAVKRSGAPVVRTITRVHEFDGASVFFQGDTVRLKDLFGVDFRSESDLFQSFDYVDGEFDPAWGAETIVLSAPTAEQLRARVGDQVVLRMQNRRGQTDTRVLVVRGITADASIYGYARAYVAHDTLADIMRLEPAEFSVMGLILDDAGETELWAQRIHEELSQILPVSDPIRSRADMTAEFRASWSGIRYFVIPLPVYIAEVTALLSAVQTGSYLLLAMIGLVVVTAVVVTYRIVLHDRTREIGTMLAVGFDRLWVLGVLTTEAIVLVACGVAAGTLLSALATWALSFARFDAVPGFDIFLDSGRLAARYTVRAFLRNAGVLLVIVIPAIVTMTTAHVFRRIPLLLKGRTV